MDWGWDRYERTNWARKDGRKRYIGHFRADNDPNHWTTQRIEFWAKHPVVALRTICQSGQDPRDFHCQVVN